MEWLIDALRPVVTELGPLLVAAIAAALAQRARGRARRLERRVDGQEAELSELKSSPPPQIP